MYISADIVCSVVGGTYSILDWLKQGAIITSQLTPIYIYYLKLIICGYSPAICQLTEDRREVKILLTELKLTSEIIIRLKKTLKVDKYVFVLIFCIFNVMP